MRGIEARKHETPIGRERARLVETPRDLERAMDIETSTVAERAMTLLTVPEVAERLRCSKATVRRLLNAGEIAGFLLATPGSRRGTWRVDAESVEEYIRRQMENAARRAKVARPPPKLDLDALAERARRISD